MTGGPRTVFASALARRMMRDTCIIQARAGGGRDPYGYPGATYSPGEPFCCAFDPGNSEEVGLSTTQAAVSSATVYFPLSRSIRTQDRVQITHRGGDGITPGTGTALSPPVTYQVIGLPEVQLTCLAVQLGTVQDTGGT